MGLFNQKENNTNSVSANWKKVRFCDMFSRLTRKNKEGNTNVLTISAQYGLINQEEFFNKPIASEDKSNYFLLYKGEFAYNKSYSSGYPFGAFKPLVRYDKGIVSPLYICFAPTDGNLCPEFYAQYFEAGLMNREIKAIAQEGARNHGLLNISVDDFFNTYILKPPLEEQQKIAEILSTQDKVIELKEKLIAEKQQQKKYLMQQLLTGKMRLKGFSGEWKKIMISDVGEVITGSTPSRKEDELWGKGFAWISAKDFKNKYINSTAEEVTEQGIQQCRKLPKGAVLVTCIASIGLNAIANIECATNQQINAIICDEAYNNEFIFYIIDNMTAYIKKLAGTTAVPIISKQQFENIKIKIPVNIDEQTAIAEILSTADKEIDLLQKELEQEKQKKKSLMQLLLTGIVRVKI